jgi:GDP-D-mannose dehydratase
MRPTDLQGTYGDTATTYAKLWWKTVTLFEDMIAQMVTYQVQKINTSL